MKSVAFPILGLIAIGFILLPVNEVYAHSGHTEPDEFNLFYALQDLHQNIVGIFSSDAKAELIAEHLAQVQVKSENGDSAQETSHRVETLTERIENDVKPSVAQLVAEVTLSGELTKINELHDDFLDYRTTWFNDYKMPDYSSLKTFESSINNLDLAEKYCQNIVASTLIKASEPYTDYIVDRCPALEDVSPEFVSSVFDGANADE